MSLQAKYKKEIAPFLKKELNLKNIEECPKLKKITVNVGIGKLVTKDTSKKAEIIKTISQDLMTITGQKPQIRPAKQSISGFSLRQGMPVGLKVTLRGKRAYDFLERLIQVVFPRVRDFQGIDPKSIDRSGSITVGVEEQLIFPEISADDTNFFFGMEITITTSANTRKEGEVLLRKLGLPLKKEQ